MIIAVALGAFFVLRGAAGHAALAVGTLVAGAFMVTRMFATEDMNIGAIVLILLLIGAAVNELLGGWRDSATSASTPRPRSA